MALLSHSREVENTEILEKAKVLESVCKEEVDAIRQADLIDAKARIRYLEKKMERNNVTMEYRIRELELDIETRIRAEVDKVLREARVPSVSGPGLIPGQ